MEFLIMQCSPASQHFIQTSIPVFSPSPCFQAPSIHILPLVSEIKFYTDTKQDVKL